MNRKYWLAGGIVIFVLLLVSSVFVVQNFLAKKSSPSPTPTPDKIYSLSPGAVGLVATYVIHTKGNSSGPALKVEVTKVSDITGIDCAMEYSHSTPDNGRLTEGIICGSGTDPNGQTFSQEVVFGTCSDVCHFHTDIKDVKIVHKVTKKD